MNELVKGVFKIVYIESSVLASVRISYKKSLRMFKGELVLKLYSTSVA